MAPAATAALFAALFSARIGSAIENLGRRPLPELTAISCKTCQLQIAVCNETI